MCSGRQPSTRTSAAGDRTGHQERAGLDAVRDDRDGSGRQRASPRPRSRSSASRRRGCARPWRSDSPPGPRPRARTRRSGRRCGRGRGRPPSGRSGRGPTPKEPKGVPRNMVAAHANRPREPRRARCPPRSRDPRAQGRQALEMHVDRALPEHAAPRKTHLSAARRRPSRGPSTPKEPRILRTSSQGATPDRSPPRRTTCDRRRRASALLPLGAQLHANRVEQTCPRRCHVRRPVDRPGARRLRIDRPPGSGRTAFFDPAVTSTRPGSSRPAAPSMTSLIQFVLPPLGRRTGPRRKGTRRAHAVGTLATLRWCASLRSAVFFIGRRSPAGPEPSRPTLGPQGIPAAVDPDEMPGRDDRPSPMSAEEIESQDFFQIPFPPTTSRGTGPRPPK